MKPRLAWFALFSVLTLGYAQTYWYYPYQVSPAVLNFNPTTDAMVCAAWLNVTPSPAGVTVSGFTPPGCPPQPPVVVWGEDPDTHTVTYAALFSAKYYGKGRANNHNTGLDTLIRYHKLYWALRIAASGDLSAVQAQLGPPLTTPPITSPPLSVATWYDWQSSQDVSYGDPVATEVTNHRKNHWFCQVYYNGKRCWSAVLTWALPVRLVVNGDELGSYQIVIDPGPIVSRSASTLSVRGGRFERPVIRPVPAEAP
ncbi:MAG TPA: hypothetical protein ENK37_11685 [Oceanithermus profundus]|uniref:Uncharacterized protein n=1 Tax=Oceanithermus profundus TaxID=187137 RepID=A0A7C4VI04_9DEIN|nr:hypothetical protein [Oceanithermus profundus]